MLLSETGLSVDWDKVISRFNEIVSESVKTYKVPETENPTNAVFYTDGGYRGAMHYFGAPPPCGGFGIFGYVYTNGEPKTGHGCSGFSPTNYGLINSGELNQLIDLSVYGAKIDDDIPRPRPEKVTVISYIEGIGGDEQYKSNNVSELAGVYYALLITKKLGIRKVHFKLDSRYALQGLFEWCPRWKDNGWKKNDGTDVSNKDLWIAAYELCNSLHEDGVVITHQWIKGHSDHMGNVRADLLAGMAMNAISKNLLPDRLEVLSPKGYWQPKINVSPYLTESCFYHDNAESTNIQDGLHFYYMGNDETPGKAIADNIIACVAIKQPDPILTQLINICRGFNVFNRMSLFVSRLDTILKPSNYLELLSSQETYCRKVVGQNEYLLPSKARLISEFFPLRRAYETASNMSSIRGILVDFIKDRLAPFYIVSDVTNYIYMSTVVKDKTKVTVNPDIEEVIPVEIKVNNDSDELMRLDLVVGVDTPKLRHFAKFIEHNPKVLVIHWYESSQAYRYVTIISSDCGVGIWAGVCSNLKITPTKR